MDESNILRAFLPEIAVRLFAHGPSDGLAIDAIHLDGMNELLRLPTMRTPVENDIPPFGPATHPQIVSKRRMFFRDTAGVMRVARRRGSRPFSLVIHCHLP